MAAATTSMQKSNRLRTAFVENKGPSYGIWVLLPLALAYHHQDHLTQSLGCQQGPQSPLLTAYDGANIVLTRWTANVPWVQRIQGTGEGKS